MNRSHVSATPTAAPRCHGRAGVLLAAALGLAATVPVMVPIPARAEASRAGMVEFPGRAMGTVTRVAIATADSTASARVAAMGHRELARVDSLMSNWTTTSEVARINREAHAGPIRVHAEVGRVIARALEVGRASGGAFDLTVEPLVRAWGFLGGRPHVPDSAAVADAFRSVGARFVEFDPETSLLRLAHPGARLDLGGIAKGYAVDRAVEALGAAGVEAALVDVSGNMRGLGTRPGSDGWSIGIRDPRDRVRYFAKLRLGLEGLSTSGKYEQFVSADGRTYGHILDPRTGRPAEGLISVTVLAPSAMDADAWSTALFVLGPEEAMRAARGDAEIAAILVEPGGDGLDVVWVERTLRGRFVLEPAASRLFRVRYF